MQRQTGGAGGNTSYYALDTAMFDGYGAKLGDTDAFTGGAEGARDSMGFQGQFGAYTDNETGLVLMGHRYYDAGTGRFLTRDPKGYGGGINLYGFTGNNPVNEMDPDGTDVDIITYTGNDLQGKAAGTHAAIAVSWPGSRTGMKWFDFGPGAPYDPKAPDKPNALTVLKGVRYRGEVQSGDWMQHDPMTFTHSIQNGEGGPEFVTELKTDAATDKRIRQWLMRTVTNSGDGGGDWLHNGSYGDYNAYDHQCSSYVCQALYAGGLKTFAFLYHLSGDNSDEDKFGAVTPNSLSDFARLAGGKIIYPALGNPRRH